MALDLRHCQLCLQQSLACSLSCVQVGSPSQVDRLPLAWEDRTPAAVATDANVSDASEPAQEAVLSTSGRRPVWDDPDDLLAQVNIAAQPRLRKLRKTEQDGIVSGMQLQLNS